MFRLVVHLMILAAITLVALCVVTLCAGCAAKRKAAEVLPGPIERGRGNLEGLKENVGEADRAFDRIIEIRMREK